MKITEKSNNKLVFTSFDAAKPGDIICVKGPRFPGDAYLEEGYYLVLPTDLYQHNYVMVGLHNNKYFTYPSPYQQIAIVEHNMEIY